MSVPLPPNEVQRLQALQSYQVLDTPAEKEFDDLTHLAAYICGTPIALISLIDAKRQWFKSRVGLNVPEFDRDLAFCAHAILQPEPLIIPDTLKDEQFVSHPLVTSEPQIRFYAGAPLINPQGLAMGTLCVLDRVPRQLGASQIEALQALARQVVIHLELRRHVSSLSAEMLEHQQMERELRESQARLQLLNSISTGLTLGISVEQVIQRVLKQISQFFPHLRVAYSTINDRGHMTVVHTKEPPGMLPLTGVVMHLALAPEYLNCLRRGDVFIVKDVEQDPRVSPLLNVMVVGSIQAILDVPLQHSDQLAGVLCFHASHPRTWSQHEITALTEVAQYLAIVIQEARTQHERRQAEEALQKQARTLIEQAQLLDLADDAIMVHDLKHQILFWNQGAEKMYGWSKQEALGQVDLILLQTQYPQPLQVVEAQLLQQGRWEGELVHTKRDGTSITVATRWVVQRNAQGRPSAVLKISNDITQRKRIERQVAAQ
ncbi:MAG: GAF domain-containing protein, partial [Leptolyngbyaceae bacterium]|nr:GAF domain-containing protein [Leptolyngbyaceae bacterium]